MFKQRLQSVWLTSVLPVGCGLVNLYRTRCFVCKGQALEKLPESQRSIAFYACGQCHRQYARQRPLSLTYRWGHPIGWVLYDYLFHSAPEEGHVQAKVSQLRAMGQRAEVLQELERELIQPTHRVGHMLGWFSESRCRRFLADVVQGARAS